MVITEKPRKRGNTGFRLISPVINISLLNLWLTKHQNRTNSEHLPSPSGEGNFVDIQRINRSIPSEVHPWLSILHFTPYLVYFCLHLSLWLTFKVLFYLEQEINDNLNGNFCGAKVYRLHNFLRLEEQNFGRFFLTLSILH